jgi:hypothetical protein
MNSLMIPGYIEQSGNVGAPVKHVWEGDGLNHFARESQVLQRDFVRITFRGVGAMALGIAEWIAWRFENALPSVDLKDCIEACWAGLIDPLYRNEWNWPKVKKIEGPVEGPSAQACYLLDEVMRLVSLSSNGAASKSIYLVYLARHVLPKKTPFDNWLKMTLARMAELYPRKSMGPLGPPVPREALDSSFVPEQTPDLLRTFLAGLKPGTNAYLKTPDQMIARGFKGTPYVI